MRTFLLNKLVRDNIVADMQQAGQKVTFKQLDTTEYLQALKAKLVDEVQEYQSADPAEMLAELADILEVIEALAIEQGTDFDSLRAAQTERKTKRGGFNQRLFVEWVELTDDDPWADYYAKDPERFKEITE